MHIETKHATRNENHSTDQHIVQVFNKVSMQKIATDHQISGVKFLCLSLGVFLCACWGVWGGGCWGVVWRGRFRKKWIHIDNKNKKFDDSLQFLKLHLSIYNLNEERNILTCFVPSQKLFK